MLREERGFSLVELMVASALLLVAVLVVLEILPLVAIKHVEVKERIVAVNLAQAFDALVQSMDDVIVETATGITFIHANGINEYKWYPVVLSENRGIYNTSIEISINGVKYTIRAFARVNNVVGMRLSDNKPVPYTGTFQNKKDLVAVVINISWDSGSRHEEMSFVRRYFKTGVGR